ncbi:MAG: hypothetical protein L3J22_03650 [Xanthomonadales bacterium]|nr:hypothetical protein [Xanthomonadales bacterium]
MFSHKRWAVTFLLMALLLVGSACSLAAEDKLELASIDRELIEMAKNDQDARKNHNLTDMLRVDKLNLIRLKEIIKQYGWPDSKRFSKDASAGAWLILQHASHDGVFQKEGLELMKQIKGGGVHPVHIAYLEDRVSLFENEVQIYGTQGYCVGSKFVLSPVKNEKDINLRRENAKLPPIEAYIEEASNKLCN